jgi:predicted ATP-binding protein involved in virulence
MLGGFDMTINKISLNNFRGIQELNITLEGKSAIFFGINGSGKTSVLYAVNFLFSRFINKITQNRFLQNIRFDRNDVRIGSTVCEIQIEISFNGKSYNCGRLFDKKRNKQIINKNDDLNALSKDYIELFEALYNDETLGSAMGIPIYVNYGVNRLVIDIPLRIRKTHVFDPLYTYENAIQPKVDFRTFFEWFRNREDYENQVRSRDDHNFVDTQLHAVRMATEKLLYGFTDLKVERDPVMRMRVSKEGIRLDINQLSDGEKCLLAMIGDLARRAAMSNPASQNPLECYGVVIIDEVELHLHPMWQQKAVSMLRHVFPNIQFLLSTHSPQVLGNVPDDMKVFELSNLESQFSILELNTLRGWDVNSILENNMKTPSQNLEVKEEIDKAYELVSVGEYSLVEEIVNDLEKITNNKNADVVKLKFLINRGKRKK